MGGVEIVMADVKIQEILDMFFSHTINIIFCTDTELVCIKHGGCAMGIIGADVDALVTRESLVTNPYICLDVFQQVAQMDGTIGVGQGAGDENSSCFIHFG
jgi:hypothetical protein